MAMAPPGQGARRTDDDDFAVDGAGDAHADVVAHSSAAAISVHQSKRGLDRGVSRDDDAAVLTTRLYLVVVSVASLVAALGASCAHDAPAAAAAPAGRVRAAPLTNAPTIALQGVDAPGFNIDDLTARLRDGVAFSSGAPIVDQASVRAEIAACIEMPCPDQQQQRFREATLVATATLAKVGPKVLGSLRITKGLKEVVRVNASGRDAGAVATELGHLGGEALRAVLTTTVAAPVEPPSAEK